MTDTGIETMRCWARQLADAADGGALAVHIIMHADWGPLFDNYMRGDALAGYLAEAVMEVTGRRRPSLRCACCHASLEAPDLTIIAVTPEKPGGPRITTTLCLQCAPDRAAVQRRIGPGLEHLLALMPGRPQQQPNEGGSA